MATRPTGPKFPTKVYIKKVEEGEEPFLLASEGIEEFGDGDLIAIYELKQTRTKRVDHGLV